MVSKYAAVFYSPPGWIAHLTPYRPILTAEIVITVITDKNPSPEII